MISKQKQKEYMKALDKYYKSIDKYTSNLSNLTINKNYHDIDRKIQGIDILIDKGNVTSKDIDKMIKTLNKYTGRGTVDLFDAYDPSLDRFVSPIKGGIVGDKSSNIFSKEDTIKEFRERKIFQPLGESKSVDYNSAIYEEFYAWLIKKPQGYASEILSLTNRVLDEYGYENTCKLFEFFQEELPDINSKVFYEQDLKPLYHLISRIHVNGWFYLDDYNEMKTNAKLNDELEQEESYE